MISKEPEAMTLYSASKDDLDTVGCFLDFQQIGDLPKRRMCPVTDRLLSGHEAQSKSKKA